MNEYNGAIPTYNVGQGQGNDMFGGGGGSWIWIILLFMLFGGRNGFGGLGNDGVAANPATNMINNDFLYTQRKIDDLGQAVINQTNALNQTLNNGFNGVNMGLCNIGHQIDSGFCGVNRNIDQVRFEAQQNTCNITTAIGESTQAVLGYLTSQEIANWRERALSAENRENNAQQTAAITSNTQSAINQRFPYPVPASVIGYGYPGGGIYSGGVPFSGGGYGHHDGHCC